MIDEALPSDELDAPPADEPAGDVLDENLAALAQAEAEVEALDARLAAGDPSLPADLVAARQAAERRRRGRAIWGALAVALLALAWTFPLLGTWLGPLWRRAAPPVGGLMAAELALLAAAVVLGTVGCRRPAGRRIAIVARLLAWNTPTVAWLLVVARLALLGRDDSGNLVIAAAAAAVWLALGLFAFATLDALLEP